MSFIVKKYATALLKSMELKAEALQEMDHDPLKGRLRELFISDILKKYLTDEFEVGSGIIINKQGYQSPETDVIIYDKKIIPPLIKESFLGLYPIESVIACFEIKSTLTYFDLKKANDNAHIIFNLIDNKDKLKDYDVPFYTVFGYKHKTAKIKNEHNKLKLRKYQYLSGICVLHEFCWLLKEDWTLKMGDDEYEETKRYIAVILDNIRTKSIERNLFLNAIHRDWLSEYIRNQ